MTLFLLRLNDGEEAGARTGEIARGVALAGRFDLDDLGAEIREHQPAARSHDHVRELDDADAFERQRTLHALVPLASQPFGMGSAPTGILAVMLRAFPSSCGAIRTLYLLRSVHMTMKLTAVYQRVPEGYVAFVEELPGAEHTGVDPGGGAREPWRSGGTALRRSSRRCGKAACRARGDTRELSARRTMKRADLVRYLLLHGCLLLREGRAHSVSSIRARIARRRCLDIASSTTSCAGRSVGISKYPTRVGTCTSLKRATAHTEAQAESAPRPPRRAIPSRGWRRCRPRDAR